MNKNYRIKDIAEMAGVSTGTVDRILHHRGKVSIEAQEKVDKVLKEINYQPNLIARSLALKKTYRFITVTPYAQPKEYWDTFGIGLSKAQEELFSYNVEVERLYYNQYDKSSFDSLIPEILTMECNGVVIAAQIQDSVHELTRELDKVAIPYVLIDAWLEDTNCIAYYGTHSYDSGYLAGKLMAGQIQPEDEIAVFRFIRKGDFLSLQVNSREKGFRDYLISHNYTGNIHRVSIHADTLENNKALLDSFFESHPQVKRGIIFNSRACLLGDYFKRSPHGSGFKLIGYDVLEANVHYLKNGLITHLIAQRPEVQGLNSIKALFRFLVLKETPERINYMPIDILYKENIQYYNNYI